MRSARWLEKLVERIESARSLDRLGEALNKAGSRVLPTGPVEDVLSGTPIGHPLHPVLVGVPIGAWTSAAVFDAAGDEAGARRLIGLGWLAALPAAASGASDWLSTDGAERRVGLVHALLNDAALTAYGLSWLARRRPGGRPAGVALSAVGVGLLTAAGWLGGHLAYAQGVGVDTTAFQKLPTDWTDVAAASEVPVPGELAQFDADGVPLVATRHGEDVVVLADRCTHRGAPLSDGEIVDGCLVCPWHGSAFSLPEGAVASGPATRPQPRLQSRVRDGRLQVRRTEPRTLRNNPVGR